jgi:hypothetical protein
MSLAQSFQKYGFPKWYERQLIESHAHLVTALLCCIGLAAGVELLVELGTVGKRLLAAFVILGACALGWWSLQRYRYTLFGAEDIANQANCPQCASYGRFDVLYERGEHGVQVRCRKCATEWKILAEPPAAP